MSITPELVRLRSDIRTSQEYMIVFVAIIIWDTIATWPGEYRYLWKQDWTSLKAVFLINRYWSICAQVVTMALVLAAVPPGACEKVFWIEIFNSLSIMLLCGVLVCYRLHKTYDHSRKVLYIFVGLLVVQMGVMTGAATQLRAYSTPQDLVMYLAAPGCSTGNPRLNARLVAGLYWTPPLLFHLAAFGAVLHRDLTTNRPGGGGRWALAQRLADEGAFNLFVTVCSLVPNVALFIQPNENLIYLNAPAALTLTSLMCSRMVLSQYVPTLTYGVDGAPTHHLRPSANHASASGGTGGTAGTGGSHATTEPYSITLNSTAPPFTPSLLHPGRLAKEDHDGDDDEDAAGRARGRGRGRGGRGASDEYDDDDDEIAPISFTPVLGKDDRPHDDVEQGRGGGEKESDEEKSEAGSGVRVGLGMTV
ncbi:hypothetical protein JCM11491_001419 [Sporobolomyces phaffii]